MLPQLLVLFMIALFSSFMVQHIQSNERSRNGRFAFSASTENFCKRLYIHVVMHGFLSCILLLFRCSMYLLVCMYLCVHKLLLKLVTCCNNRAVFIFVGGLVIVFALAFAYCS